MLPGDEPLSGIENTTGEPAQDDSVVHQADGQQKAFRDEVDRRQDVEDREAH
jgi:hypothetical protein